MLGLSRTVLSPMDITIAVRAYFNECVIYNITTNCSSKQNVTYNCEQHHINPVYLFTSGHRGMAQDVLALTLSAYVGNQKQIVFERNTL